MLIINIIHFWQKWISYFNISRIVNPGFFTQMVLFTSHIVAPKIYRYFHIYVLFVWSIEPIWYQKQICRCCSSHTLCDLYSIWIYIYNIQINHEWDSHLLIFTSIWIFISILILILYSTLWHILKIIVGKWINTNIQ